MVKSMKDLKKKVVFPRNSMAGDESKIIKGLEAIPLLTRK